jgi:hypothetical protein
MDGFDFSALNVKNGVTGVSSVSGTDKPNAYTGYSVTPRETVCDTCDTTPGGGCHSTQNDKTIAAIGIQRDVTSVTPVTPVTPEKASSVNDAASTYWRVWRPLEGGGGSVPCLSVTDDGATHAEIMAWHRGAIHAEPMTRGEWVKEYGWESGAQAVGVE